jgi:4-diphosphocytidyl-2-C-methyl-D-erythritol kinase
VSSAPRAVSIEAPAKVNLLLRVLGRLPSGYHELETLFQAVGLYDRLVVERTNEAGVAVEATGLDAGPVEDNLAGRAARTYLDEAGVPDGVRVRLDKVIPAGAGLGGGSSDAAAVLRALDRLYEGAVAPDRLRELGAALGSDVPFFLGASPFALGEGRGERLTPLPPLPQAAIVLGLPPAHVATGPAYAALARARQRDGSGVPKRVLQRGPPGDWHGVAEVALNDFEHVVLPGYRAVTRALRALQQGESPLALLSGSGSAVFALHPDLQLAEAAAAAAGVLAPDTVFLAVPTLTSWPPVRDEPPTGAQP